MGNLVSRAKKCRAIIHGLDAAGKTSILYRMKQGVVITTTPTIGFNVETLHIRGYEFTAWDVGGRDKMRPLWRHYYKHTDALIFVIDSNDGQRMEQARDELFRAVQEEELRGIPVLIFCNKQDLPKALPPDDISKILGLEKIIERKVIIVGCSAYTGHGLKEGLAKLKDALDGKNDEEIHREGKLAKTLAAVEQEALKLDYDPTAKGGNQTLKYFDAIKHGTECPFAKSAKLWGGKPVKNGSSLEDQAKANVVAIVEFTRRSRDFSGGCLDGFCIELDDTRARDGGPEELGSCVRQMLTALSDIDPAKEFVMRVSYIGARGWRFRFNRVDFFVTTFAPCYPCTSSRFAFGTGRAFVLLQPEVSFARHNLPRDSPATNWEQPKTVRDTTRLAFRDAGRPYFIPTTTVYPPAEHIVKPLRDNGNSVVRWWQHGGDDKERI